MDVISIGAPLARVLERAPDSRVVARFDSTLDLETRDGARWAITRQPNQGAMRIVAPVIPGWRQGARVCAHKGKVFAEGVELAWSASARFDPTPRKRALSATQRRHAARAIAAALAHWPLPNALGFWDELSELWPLVASVSASPKGAKQSHNSQQRDCFVASFDTLRSPRVAPRNDTLDVLVSRLLGRGSGLTPTGDDFLQALLVTLSSGDDADRAAFESLKGAVEPQLNRTTRVSRAFLEEALQGWAFGALKDILDVLPLVTQDKLNALLSVGATSGPAYAFGMLMGLSWKEKTTGDA